MPRFLGGLVLLALARGYLGCLDGAHLGDPGSRGLDLAHGTKLVRGVARDADIVSAFQDELDVANLEDL